MPATLPRPWVSSGMPFNPDVEFKVMSTQEDTTAAPASKVYQLNVTKAKAQLGCVFDNLPEHIYEAMLILGGQLLLNSGMSKITKKEFNGDVEAMQAAAMAKAQENVEAMYAGTIKLPLSVRAKKIKVPAEVLTHARAMAKALVKDELKRQGIKLKYVAAKDITAAANLYLEGEEGPALIKEAEAAIAARKSKKAKISIAGIKPDEKLIKADQEKAAKAKEQATEAEAQAGRVMAQMRQQPPVRDRRGS